MNFFKLSHQDETFSFSPKFHIFNDSDLEKERVFGLKMRSGRKMTFLDFSCFLNSLHQVETFSFLPKFHTFNGFDFKKKVFFG